MPERRPSLTSTFFSGETASREQLVQRMAELTEILKQPAPADNMNEYKEALAEEAAAKEVYEQEAMFLRAKNVELSERATALTAQITLIRNQRAAISAEANQLRLAAGDSAAARELAHTDLERLKKELEQKQVSFAADLLVERSRAQEAQRHAEEERAALQARSAAQLADADRLRLENRALQNRLEDLGNSQSVCSLRGELKLRDIRIQDLETELDSLKTVQQDHDIEKLTHENDYLAMRLDELKAELAQQQRESEISKCQDHEQQMATLASDVEKLQGELKQASALSEELERTKTDLANALLRRSSSDLETRQETEKLQAVNQSLTIQVTSLSLAVTKKSDQIADLQEKLSTTENQPLPGNEGDASKLKDQDARMAALSVELEEARNEVDVTKNRAHAALRQRDSAQEECQRLRSELAQLKTELQKERVCVPAEAEAQGLYDDIAELESQLRLLSAESLQRDMKNEGLEAEVARAKEESVELRLQLTRASTEKQAVDEKLEEMGATAAELQDVITELKAHNFQLKEVTETRACTSDSCEGNDNPSTDAAEKTLEDAKKFFQETIAAMEAQKALASATEHESAIMSLRQQLDRAPDMRKELSAQQCASERLQREVASLKLQRQEIEAEWRKEFRFHEDSLTAAKIARHRAESERDGLKCLLEQESSSRLKLTKQVALLQKSVRRQEPTPKSRVCNSQLLELEVARSELEVARSEILRLESLIPTSREPTSFKSLKPVVSALVSGTFIAALCGVVM